MPLMACECCSPKHGVFAAGAISTPVCLALQWSARQASGTEAATNEAVY